ncbi:MAG: LamG domain-containing protein [Phycisphaerales bacterium]|nr:MAG: LamG domain-containing protein [Phycisphaerales bacterium]
MSVGFVSSSSEYLKTAGTSILNGLSAVTVACWTYPTDLANNLWFLNAWHTSTGALKRQVGFRAAATSGELHAFISTSTVYGGDLDLAVSVNSWQHVAMTWDGTTLKGYLDGSSTGSKTYTFGGSVQNQTDNELLLARYAATYADMRVEDRAIWNRALGDDEIHALYAGRLRAVHIPNGLLHYWPLDAPGDSSYGDFTDGDYGGRDLVGDLPAILGAAPAWSPSSPGLHWSSQPYRVFTTPTDGQTAARRVSLGGTFIDSTRVVLAG